jgi:hypothetical protein
MAVPRLSQSFYAAKTLFRHHLSPLLKRRSNIMFESEMILLAYDLYFWYAIWPMFKRNARMLYLLPVFALLR